ncbi:YfcE family phosphodiesterase [Candidatus Gracilibacteria bacterium]|nr:YfcE family phosphodiesterase [Candidatus Gracilibacteria bacterium]
MRIAIISDSHGALDRLEEALGNLQNGGVSEVIHAGDFALGWIVDVLKKFPALSFRIARGNCDVDTETLETVKNLPNVELADVLSFELAGKKFAAAHKIQDLRETEAEIFVSGHTHIPRIEKINGKLFLNPGSLQDDGGYFLLETETLAVERKLFTEKI